MFKIFLVFFALFVLTISADTDINCPKIKTRRKWGGAEPKEIDYQTIPVQYVIVHHTVGNKCSTFSQCSDEVKNIQDYHMQSLGFTDIGYNFLIGNDGYVYEGAGWHKIGAHTFGYNSKSLGIAFLGDFSNELPSSQALLAAKQLLNCGVNRGELDKRYRLLAGRQVLATASPGLKLFTELQEWENWAANP